MKEFTMKIFPQKCYKCGKSLQSGEEVRAHTVNPVAFCLKCVEEAGKVLDPQFAKAVVTE